MTLSGERQIRSTGVGVTKLGLGAAPLGGLFEAVDEQEAVATVHAALANGVRYLDTAPFYGFGLSETRVGEALRDVPRDSYTLSTKVGRVIVDGEAPPGDAFVEGRNKRAVFDYSRDGVLRSLEESLQRLGIDRVDIAYIHDCDDHFDEAIGGAYPALEQLRSEGVVGAIGAGLNQTEMLTRFVTETDMDVVLCAGRYTLLDPKATEDLFPACLARGVAVVMGGVFNSGILVDPYADGARYNYEPASPGMLARARSLAEICARYDAPLAAAALQFPMRHEAVTSVLTGVRSTSELETNVALATTAIPDELWAELDAAISA